MNFNKVYDEKNTIPTKTEEEIILEGVQVRVKGRFERLIYPKTGSKITPDTWCIFTFRISDVEDGYMPDDAVFGNRVIRPLTFKGRVPSLEYGLDYCITANFIEDPKYGLQLDILTMNTVFDMTDPIAQRNFFSYVLTDREMEMLYSATDNPVALLEKKDMESLQKIKGIGPAKAASLIQKYEDNKDKGAAYAKLVGYGLTKNAIDKLCERYKYPEVVIEKIQNNPYILITEAHGFGWAKCDQIAANAGWGENSPERICAWINYFLRNQAETEGHTWLVLDDLVDSIYSIAPYLEAEDCKTILQDMMKEDKLFYDKETDRIGLKKYRKLEENIVAELFRIINGTKTDWGDIEKGIVEAEIESGFEYTNEQKGAVRTILNNKVTILSSKAGTGKSSSMLPVVKIAKQKGKMIDLCALSGKASLNLATITGVEGKTIHRLLRTDPKTGKFLHNKEFPLYTDIVILDELSMVGGELFLNLLEAIPDTATLILIGDPGQLESIGLCNLLKDMVASGAIPVAKLNKILRQAMKSGILADSSEIYEGRQIIPPDFSGSIIHGELKDFKITAVDDAQSAAICALEEFKSLYNVAKIPLSDIIVLTAKRAIGSASARAMNEYIQREVNGIRTEGVTIHYKDGEQSYEITYKEGDRILITENNYGVDTLDGEGQVDLFNGNIGNVLWTGENILGAEFPQGKVVLDKDLLLKCQLGYAITTHKSQGSGIPYVIGIADPSAYTLMSREFLYTMITRAKRYCSLIGPVRTIRMAVQTSRVKKKQTWLPELLQKEEEKYFKNPTNLLDNNE